MMDVSTTALCGLPVKFVDVDGIRTRVYDLGSGEPIVLWHGSGWTGGASANTWTLNIGSLARRFRVIAADKLGSGLTDNPASAEEFTIEAQVAHAAGLLRVLGVDSCHMVGQSRGAYLAARLALEAPELARTLTLVDSATLAPDIGDIEERRRTIFRAAPRDPLEWARSVHAGFSYSSAHVSDEFVEAYVAMDQSEKSQATKAMWHAGGAERFDTTLAQQKQQTLEWIDAGRLSMPTLLTWSRNDKTALLQQGLDLFERIANANPCTRMHIFNQAGHFPYREYPEEWNALVTQFIEQFGGNQLSPSTRSSAA